MGNKNQPLNWWPWVVGILLSAFVFGFQVDGKAAETGEFSGTWIANGTKESFPFGDAGEIYTYEVSGHVNLQTSLGKKKDYWSKCIGLSDSMRGNITRCVWQDLDGTEIYITLQSNQMQEDGLVTGTIVGGNNQLKDIEGTLSFKWASVTFQKNGNTETVTGRATGLKGTYKVP